MAKTEADFEVKEVFLGFDDLSADRQAPSIAEFALGVLEKYDWVDRLVAHIYELMSCCNGIRA